MKSPLQIPIREYPTLAADILHPLEDYSDEHTLATVQQDELNYQNPQRARGCCGRPC